MNHFQVYCYQYSIRKTIIVPRRNITLPKVFYIKVVFLMFEEIVIHPFFMTAYLIVHNLTLHRFKVPFSE